MIDIIGYGTLTVVFQGNLTVKLLDVTYVPDTSCFLRSLMADHWRGVGFRTEENDTCFSLFWQQAQVRRGIELCWLRQ